MAEQEKTGKEKLDFLSRKEVRTMAKDIARLRNEEAESERKRILEMRLTQKKKEAAGKTEKGQSEMEQIRSSLAPEPGAPGIPLPKPLSKKQKIMVRVIAGLVIVFFLANGALFFYWYFLKKEAPRAAPSAAKQVSKNDEGAPKEKLRPQKPAPPIMKAESDVSLSVPQNELLPALSGLLSKERARGITLISLKNSEEKEWSPKEIFAGLRITDPQNISSKIGRASLFIYRGQRKRIGIVGSAISAKETAKALSLWEPSMEADTKAMFGIMEASKKGYSPQFRSTQYKDIPIRFQTFSLEDLGIVYAAPDGYFILTSSLESAKAAIDSLFTEQ